MKNPLLLILFLTATTAIAQKNFIDEPYLETTSRVDTLVAPDRIYLNIVLLEKDSKGNVSVEELESKMLKKLSLLGIDMQKQLSVNDMSSNFRKYFLKSQDILKAKQFSLLVYDAATAGRVIQNLEQENISNITLEKTEYSKLEQLKLELKAKAVANAKQNAVVLTKPLNQFVRNAIYISDLEATVINSLRGKVAGVVIRGATTLSETAQDEQFPEIEFEKIKVEVAVSAKFRIE